jgi:hypothetical protein
LALSETFGNRADRAAEISASDARSFAPSASRSGRWRSASLSTPSTVRAVRGVLKGDGLCEIVLRLRSRAPGELDVNDGVETAAEQRLGGLLHDLGVGQALPRCAGIGTVQRETRAGDVEDQLLMHRRERHVPGDRKLTRRFDRGCRNRAADSLWRAAGMNS